MTDLSLLARRLSLVAWRTPFFSALIVAGVVALRPAPAFAQASGNPFSSCKNWQVQKEHFDSVPVAPAATANPAPSGSETGGPSQTPEIIHELTLTGSPVKIVCDDTTVFANMVRWRDDSPMIYASGDVLYEQEGTRILADHAELNRKTSLGTFFSASGLLELAGTQVFEPGFFGSQDPQASFYAERIDKIGNRVYKLTNGGFTTCTQPTPRWEMTASSVVLVLDKHAHAPEHGAQGQGRAGVLPPRDVLPDQQAEPRHRVPHAELR